MAKKWQFVSNQVEDGAGKDEGTRKIVRKAAMKAFRRNQRLEQVKTFMQGERDESNFRDLQTPEETAGNGSDELPSERHKGFGQSGAPIIYQNMDGEGSHDDLSKLAMLEQGQDPAAAVTSFGWLQEIVSLDPFGSSPLGNSSTWHFLFTYFVYEIAPMIQPLGINNHLNPVNTQWARHAMTDPALFHGVLFHASVHVNFRQGEPWSATTLFHRGETIRLVSERLNSSDDLVTDNTIAAVGWVAAEGNITGNIEGNQIHWDAIGQMLKARGGLEPLGWNGALELLLTLSNIIFSMVGGTIPMVEPPTLANVDFPDIPPSILHNTSTVLTVLEFGEYIMSLVRFMSELTIAQSTLIHTPGVTAEEIITFNKLRSAAEHRLLSVRVSSPTISPMNQLEAAVYESCRIVALMCSNFIFREFTPRAAAFRGLKRGLLLALNEIEKNDYEDVRNFEELLLWVYFVCGMISTSAEIERFSSRIVTSMSNLGFEDWTKVEQCLTRCIWSEKMYNQFCLAFWKKVTDLLYAEDRSTSRHESGNLG
ncbi:hypothetical protein EG329_011080 [Mollisiaceae sp. DMI_Dod_QoI]|nr:hypothetical protein EG329_011080 [Helotiales sp. DMI_Dod_QoI]